MEYERAEIARQIIEAGNRLVETGLSARTWGNISARLSEDTMLITPSGLSYETLTPERLVEVSIKDCSYSGDIKPSSEMGIHADVYRFRDDVNFVIHTHQAYATAVSILPKRAGNLTEYITDRDLLGDYIPCGEYGVSCSKKLQSKVNKCLLAHRKVRAMLLKSHGTLCLGRDYEDAFAIAEALEETCKAKYDAVRQGVTDLGPSKPDMADFHLCTPEEYPDYYEAIGETGGCIIHAQSPAIMEMSMCGFHMHLFVDDITQLCGISVHCCRDEMELAYYMKRLPKKGAVYYFGEGAYCYGANEEEAIATCLVLEKAAKAALLAGYTCCGHRVPYFTALREQKMYRDHYSKLKMVTE